MTVAERSALCEWQRAEGRGQKSRRCAARVSAMKDSLSSALSSFRVKAWREPSSPTRITHGESPSPRGERGEGARRADEGHSGEEHGESAPHPAFGHPLPAHAGRGALDMRAARANNHLSSFRMTEHRRAGARRVDRRGIPRCARNDTCCAMCPLPSALCDPRLQFGHGPGRYPRRVREEANGVWWLPRSSKPLFRRGSVEGLVRFRHASATRVPKHRERRAMTSRSALSRATTSRRLQHRQPPRREASARGPTWARPSGSRPSARRPRGPRPSPQRRRRTAGCPRS
jgi:hypothetical protein